MTRPCSLRGAPGLLLVTLLAAPAASTLLACGSATRDAGLTCSAPADCGPGAFCVQGSCQASTPPVADFTLPANLTTNRLVTVASTSSDPDAGDAVTSWAWSITPLTAGCAADADVADQATLRAVFWCPGTYQVSLVVQDTTGAESAPTARTVTVSALPGAPSVTAGTAAAVEHRCAGAPLRCGLEQPVSLSADAQPAGSGLTYRWTALPPDPSRAAAVATLTPSSASRTPSLSLETAGGPISGTWRLRVRVEDGAGNLAQAVQLVSVGNRAPVIDQAPLSLEHTYQAGAYRAAGTLAVSTSDPDGDPLSTGVALVEPTGSGCTASFLAAAGTAGALSLSCPTPVGLQAAGRALRATATDVNGAAVTAQPAILIQNRLPLLRPAGGLQRLDLDHHVGPCPGGTGRCFQVSGANPFVAEDPDGDPVSAITLVPLLDPALAASTGQALAGGAFTFSTPVSHPGEFRAPDGSSGFAVSATAADPFGASAPADPLLIRILNRAPVVRTAAPLVTVDHRYDVATSSYLASAALAAFDDPDGDPLVDAGSTGDESCPTVALVDGQASAACARGFAISGAAYPTLSGFFGNHPVTVRAGDGWAIATAGTTVAIADRTPGLPAFNGAIEACRCECPLWEADLPGVCALDPVWVADAGKATFPAHPSDVDGDPLAVSFAVASGPAGAKVTPTSGVTLPGACSATLSTSAFPVSVLVTVNDGVSEARATWTATAVVCAKAGQVCSTPAPPPPARR